MKKLNLPDNRKMFLLPFGGKTKDFIMPFNASIDNRKGQKLVKHGRWETKLGKGIARR